MALYLSRSDHARLQEFTTREVAIDVEERSVAICGTDVVVAYFRRAPAVDRRLLPARVPGGGGAISRVEVRAPVRNRGTIDVACTADRAYVAWSEHAAADQRRDLRSSVRGRRAVRADRGPRGRGG